jgi:hypothetical protein
LALPAEDIDWRDRTIGYSRRKTGTSSIISFGDEVAGILKTLPKTGQLVPALARIHERHRAKMFIKRLNTVNITGVSLHSYRYAYAERAKDAGYPERFASRPWDTAQGRAPRLRQESPGGCAAIGGL